MKCCSSLGCEGSYPFVWLLHCTKVPITKDFIHAVKHSEYALFLENQRKQALLEEEKKKKEAEEAKRVDQRTRKHLHEQLAQAMLSVGNEKLTACTK